MKHTPGPWHAVKQNEDWIAVVHDKAIDCGFIDVWGHVTPGYDLEANARLVAAAPELLNAVRFLLSNPDNRISAADREDAYRAIAKATGDQP